MSLHMLQNGETKRRTNKRRNKRFKTKTDLIKAGGAKVVMAMAPGRRALSKIDGSLTSPSLQSFLIAYGADLHHTLWDTKATASYVMGCIIRWQCVGALYDAWGLCLMCAGFIMGSRM